MLAFTFVRFEILMKKSVEIVIFDCLRMKSVRPLFEKICAFIIKVDE